ncbi:hypothetical protein ACWXVT_01755 [Mycoplasma sp. 1573]
MERKVLVFLKLKSKNFEVSALECINNNFYTLFQKDIEFKQALAQVKNAFEEIQRIVNVKKTINNVICVFDKPESLKTQVINYQANYHGQKFDALCLKEIENHFANNLGNDYLISKRDLKVAANVDNNFQEYKNLKQLINKNVNQLMLESRLSFIDSEAFEMMQALVKKLNLKVEKFLSQNEVNAIYLASNVYSSQKQISVTLGKEHLELSLIQKENLINYKAINFGLANLVKQIAKKHNLSFQEAQNILVSYPKMVKDAYQSLTYRNNLKTYQLYSLINNFWETIYQEIKAFSQENDLIGVNVVINKSNLINLENMMQFFKTISEDFTFSLNKQSFVDKNLKLNNSAIINYLCFNDYEQDITNTFIIDTNVIRDVKTKTSIFNRIRMLFN